MKKCFAALCAFLLLVAGVQLACAEHGALQDCGCPAEAGYTASYPTYYHSMGADGHILIEKCLIYCAGCGAYLGRGSDCAISGIEPHVMDEYGNGCVLCDYWKLGTATMYDSAGYTALQSAAVGSIVTFGSYEQDGVYYNGAEPIEWIVLDRRGSQVLLLSRYGLDVQPYHHTATAINWSNSSVRNWLQSDFFNEAFTAQEQGMIATTRNSTPINSNNAGSPGPDTYDTVFFLSSTEATKYLTTQESRMVKATTYALMHGAGTNYSQNSYWWLRSYADSSRKRVLMINSQGNVYASTIDDYQAVVRPAIWVNVD
ncbi:MAG: DUF6273 domain-containing protein [Aristaeellaceae bacterium]